MKIFSWDNNILQVENKTVLGARQCKIIVPTLAETIDFLSKYHYQKSCNGQIIRFGLVYNNLLVGIMTFGLPRYTKKFQYELLRLCFHPNFIIKGGSERLFKEFINKYTPNSIISYCDKSKFTGNVYTRLNMKKISNGQPRIHFWRESDRRHITMAELIKYGPDKLLNVNYGKGTNNIEIMEKEGFEQIKDCGQDSYVYLDETQYFGYIYCTTEISTGKQYIGQHISNTFDPTYQGSGKIISRLLKKHPDNFKTEILEWCKQDISEREIYWIKKLNTLSPNGYNLTLRLQNFENFDHETLSIKRKRFYQTEEGKLLIQKQKEKQKAFYQTEEGKQLLKQNRQKIIEHYASEKGLKTRELLSKKNNEYYASEKGQAELKQRAKNYSEFCKTEEGKKMTASRNKKLQELNKTDKGKEKEQLRIQSLRDFYASEEGKLAKEKQVAKFIENSKSEERQKKRKEQAQRYSEWANSPEGQAILRKAAQEKRARWIQAQTEKVNAMSDEEWEEFKKKYPRTTLSKYRKK